MLKELLFWSEIKNFCANVLDKDPNFCAKVLHLMDLKLHFMITGEGAKPPPKSSSQVDPLD